MLENSAILDCTRFNHWIHYSIFTVDSGRFWQQLVQEETVQAVTPLQRWSVDGIYNPEGGPGKVYTRLAAFIEVSLHECDILSLSFAQLDTGLPPAWQEPAVV